jgi:hypothetical protein
MNGALDKHKTARALYAQRGGKEEPQRTAPGRSPPRHGAAARRRGGRGGIPCQGGAAEKPDTISFLLRRRGAPQPRTAQSPDPRAFRPLRAAKTGSADVRRPYSKAGAADVRLTSDVTPRRGGRGRCGRAFLERAPGESCRRRA